MLPKQYRLPLRTEFKRIKKTGKLFSGKLFSLLIALQPQASRFAFIISKKIDKRATKRNRVRRLLSEAVRELLPKIKSGVEGVFLVKKTIIKANYQQVKREVDLLFQKAKLIV